MCDSWLIEYIYADIIELVLFIKKSVSVAAVTDFFITFVRF